MRLAPLIAIAACSIPAAAGAIEPGEVLDAYADVAAAMYEDALAAARDLDAAIDALAAAPTEETLAAARTAWLAARVPYQQTEGLRFGNAIVDDWEGRVNAWPLDEGLIDYVDASAYGDASDENPLYTANVIASEVIRIGPDEVDVREITPALLSGSLQEAQGVESNVATGYHAIEFLLWGQDLHGTGPGAGERPATDFDPAACTGGHCDRRVAYLQAAGDLLVSDLEEMAANWAPGGAARAALAQTGLSAILTGLGSLSYGELAGERIKLGLLLHDPEEEHDCFSDNTHNSHYYDQVGMIALYEGRYRRTDGSLVEGPGLAAYAAETAPAEHEAVATLMADTLARMEVMKASADSGAMAYDQMIGPDNPEGNAVIEAVVEALVAQTRGLEALVAALDLDITVEGSDSLDNPAAVTTQ
jgi:putative iron-regulated protein